MDIAVGSIVGAAVGWPGLYLQNRMKRKEEVHDLGMKSAHESWSLAHETALAIAALARRHDLLSEDFYQQVNRLGGQLDATAMVLHREGRQIRIAGRILRYMEPGGKVSDSEKLTIARDVIEYAQWLLSAFMISQPIVWKLERLEEYEEMICGY